MGSYGKIDILDILIIVYFGQPKMIGVAPVLELPCDWVSHDSITFTFM